LAIVCGQLAHASRLRVVVIKLLLLLQAAAGCMALEQTPPIQVINANNSSVKNKKQTTRTSELCKSTTLGKGNKSHDQKHLNASNRKANRDCECGRG